VSATFANTIVTITDVQGNAVRGARHIRLQGQPQGTPYAAHGGATAAKTAMDMRMMGRPSCQRPRPWTRGGYPTLRATGLRVSSITDVTPIPHNGCRPPKKRRV
jgi:small subunit ribosomal protein S11